jgi:hypothetical protein
MVGLDVRAEARTYPQNKTRRLPASRFYWWRKQDSARLSCLHFYCNIGEVTGLSEPFSQDAREAGDAGAKQNKAAGFGNRCATRGRHELSNRRVQEFCWEESSIQERRRADNVSRAVSVHKC